jgi:nitrogen fixation protein NifQ
MSQASYDKLLSGARTRDDLLCLAFAGVISHAIAAHRLPIIRGLSENRFRRLLNEYFPEVEIENGVGAEDLPGAAAFAGLVALLIASRVEPTEQRAWLSYAIASSAMAAGELWREMGLPGPQLLDDLMRENFPALAAANDGPLDWKTTLHRLRCARGGVLSCKPDECDDRVLCEIEGSDVSSSSKG